MIIEDIVHEGSPILGLQPCDKAAMLVVCWLSIEYNFFSKNLHENRV